MQALDQSEYENIPWNDKYKYTVVNFLVAIKMNQKLNDTGS